SAFEDLALGDRFVVLTVLGLGGWGDHRPLEPLVLFQTGLERDAVCGMPSALVVPPEAPGEVTAHHEFDRKRLAALGDGDVRVWNSDGVIGNQVLGLLEPKVG